jgi:hypothetical protein
MINSILKKGSVTDKHKIETLLYCLLSVCLRFTLKLNEAEFYLRNILQNRKSRDTTYDTIYAAYRKVEYAIKYNVANNLNNNPDLQILFGKAFESEHPIFKFYYTKSDDDILISSIKAEQMIQDINANLHTEDPFQLKSMSRALTMSSKIQHIPLHYMFSRSHTTIISQPSDPIAVTASYVLLPDIYTVRLHVTVHNTTSTEAYNVVAEIGIDGTVTQFDNSPQTTEIVGDLSANTSYEFQRDFLTYQFSLATFNISILLSTEKQAQGASDLLSGGSSTNNIITIRCAPFELKLFHFLQRPVKMSHADFLTLWELYKSSFHKRITFESNKLSDAVAIVEQIMQQHQLQTSSNPFYKVPQKSPQIRQNAFQHCYASRTLFGDYILLVVFCHSYFQPNIMVCNFEFRTSSSQTMSVLLKDKSKWFEEELAFAPSPLSYHGPKSKLVNLRKHKIQVLPEGMSF